MSVLSDSARRNSTVFTVYTDLRTRFRRAHRGARVLRPLKQFRGKERSQQSEGDSPTQSAGDSPVETPASRGAQATSTTYRLAGRLQSLVIQSWLFNWLTAEPEPEVIVIDLRETVIVGRIRTVLDRGIDLTTRELTPAIRTASLSGVVYRVKNLVVRRPIRLFSAVVALMLNFALLSGVMGGAEILSAQTFLILGGLVLAARGLVSSMTWAELTETTVYQVTKNGIVAVFEPPETPDRRDE